GDALAETIGTGVLGGRAGGVRIDVDRERVGGPGACRRKRKDARPGSDVGDLLADEIETIDELGEPFAADEIARVKYRRAHQEPEAGRPGHARALPREDKMVGEEVNESPQGSAEQTVRRAATIKRACAVFAGRLAGSLLFIHGR